ncbi:MAG: hypothetical protein CL707_08480 [Chloroflexi bacterium]|nr:hypothetical protein [Chloroflexota bacterium]|tara:strand:- start:1360 stop:2136 length:777 start_codon:yes stop_codon:yes gene_type:complete
MIKILLKNNTIVAFDPDHKINVDELNKYLISLIDKIDGHSQLVQRAIRQEEYLLINQYANVSVNFLVDIFNKFLEQFKIEYDWDDKFSDESFSDFLPNRDISTGEMAGGKTPDTKQIEKGIEPLVEILNEFEGIQTFTSCEGHDDRRRGESLAYVNWRASSLDGLNYSTFILKNAIKTVWEKIDNKDFNTYQTTNKISLKFNTSLWRNSEYGSRDGVCVRGAKYGENFYKFDFPYEYRLQKLVFNIIKDIAFEMKKNK